MNRIFFLIFFLNLQLYSFESPFYDWEEDFNGVWRRRIANIVKENNFYNDEKKALIKDILNQVDKKNRLLIFLIQEVIYLDAVELMKNLIDIQAIKEIVNKHTK